MTLAMTVVGYGDSRSMPDLATYKEDYTQLLVTMLVGFFSFQMSNAQLRGFFEGDYIKEIESYEHHADALMDNIEQYMINHNQMNDVK